MKTKLLIIFLFTSAKFFCQDLSNNKLLENYYSAGIPSLNKSWSAEEYIKAINLVLEQEKNGLLELLSQKNNSIELLTKLTNYNDYWFLNSDYLSESSKFEFTNNFEPALAKLMVKYIMQGYDNQKLIYSKEAVQCNIALLKILNKNIQLANNFVRQNPNLSEIQKQGLAQMKQGLNTVLTGTFITLQNDYKYYNEEDICKLSPVIFDFYNNIKNSIDDVSRKEFDQKAISIQNNHELKCVKATAVLD